MPHDHDGGVPRVRLARGRRGAQATAERGDILIVIDTLRFSTAAATAVHHSATQRVTACFLVRGTMIFAHEADPVTPDPSLLALGIVARSWVSQVEGSTSTDASHTGTARRKSYG